MKKLIRFLNFVVIVLAATVISIAVIDGYFRPAGEAGAHPAAKSGISGGLTSDAKHLVSDMASSAQSMIESISSAVSQAVASLSGGGGQPAAPSGGAQSLKAASSASSGSQPAPTAANITAAPPAAVSDEAASQASGSCWDTTSIGGLKIYEYGRTLLSAQEQACYDAIAEAARNVTPSVTIKTPLAPAAVEKVYQYYIWDHVEAFYLCGCNVSYSYRQIVNKTVYESYTLSFAYDCDRPTVSRMRAQIASAAQSMLSAVSGKKSDYGKELALHDALVRACHYDSAAADNPSGYPLAYTLYGALVNDSPSGAASGSHGAVCEGYAKAMKLLLDSAGVESLYVSGTATNGSVAGGHAWNMVDVGGKWYYLDATFDDPVFIGAPGKSTVSYTYFNKTSFPDHTIGTFDTADPFSADSENYAVMPALAQ